jgi:hypothetical protein
MIKVQNLDVSKLGELREIPGFPNHLAASAGYIVYHKGGKPVRTIGRVDKAGYVRVVLKKAEDITEEQRKKFGSPFVHRIIANVFIPNPDNLSDADHVDGNKANNAVSNLRWTTRKDNMHAAFARLGNWLAKSRVDSSISVRRIDMFTHEVVEFKSARKAAIQSGNHHRAANICKAIQTKRMAHGGYWSKLTTPLKDAMACANYLPPLADVLPPPV